MTAKCAATHCFLYNKDYPSKMLIMPRLKSLDVKACACQCLVVDSVHCLGASVHLHVDISNVEFPRGLVWAAYHMKSDFPVS